MLLLSLGLVPWVGRWWGMRIDTEDGLRLLFEAQGRKRGEVAGRDAKARKARLLRLRAAILERQGELEAALHRDYRKPAAEAWLTEIYPTIEELDFTVRHLSSWMRDKRAPGVDVFPLARGRLRHEALGRVLILSPWNYPFQLLIAPLISALAAGNVVIAKPSNKTPATAAFIASLIESIFPQDEVAVVEGPGAVLGEALLSLPFDHIFFTGSPRIGAHVGEAAARVHASLTLELGGKSPVVILPDADIDEAARRIVWAKHLNAGQTCIAPDYVLCPRDLVDSFAGAAHRWVRTYYGEDEAARKASPDLARIIDRGACARHGALVDQALAAGATRVYGGDFLPEEGYAPPTLLTGVEPDMDVMAEEIFGPILPVLAYGELGEALDLIGSRPKPLALYVFGKARAEEVLSRTTSGSACVNDLIVQIENLHLPFGGVGMSGTGSYHGQFGFRTFSHERNIMVQGPINLTALFYPPYRGRVQGLARSLVSRLKGMGSPDSVRAAGGRGVHEGEAQGGGDILAVPE